MLHVASTTPPFHSVIVAGMTPVQSVQSVQRWYFCTLSGDKEEFLSLANCLTGWIRIRCWKYLIMLQQPSRSMLLRYVWLFDYDLCMCHAGRLRLIGKVWCCLNPYYNYKIYFIISMFKCSSINANIVRKMALHSSSKIAQWFERRQNSKPPTLPSIFYGEADFV